MDFFSLPWVLLRELLSAPRIYLPAEGFYFLHHYDVFVYPPKISKQYFILGKNDFKLFKIFGIRFS